MKESPRQRMIGMMYLVLTALLALQVSSTIIEKFIALNDNMEQTVTLNSGYNADKLQNIKLSVKNRGDKPQEVVLVQKTEQLHEETLALISYMESLKRNLIEKAGGRNEEGKLKGANEETAVEVYMLGSDLQKGKAYELKSRLNDYCQFMNEQFDQSYMSLAQDGKENTLYKNSAEHKNKDFAQLNFGQTPLAAALAVISEMETKIVSMENTVLTETAGKLGAQDYKFDKLMPMVRANSHFVPAGTPYQAEVFLTATSSSLRPEMNAGGQQLTIDPNGIGNYKFIASGGNYDAEGMLKKTWTASIKMKKPDGTDTTLQVKEDYVVVKPVVQINSAAQKLLYKNCGNKMDVLVPALGAYYNPDFSVDGAVLKKLSGQGKIIIVPQAATVKLRIKNQGQLIEERLFNVKLIPKPEVEVKVNNKLVDPLLGVDYKSLRSVSVKIIPDTDFKNNQPEDAYYEVVEWKLRVANGRNASFNQSVHSPVFSFSSSANIKMTDRLLVEVIKVRRRNYLGQWEEVNMSNKPTTISLF
ncbi:MAG: protein involved in gliding motility GldM [Chitinophagaceae bacterium]|nr:protein involved in gliding motility GldM [Chitinophagaceae bacterium]